MKTSDRDIFICPFHEGPVVEPCRLEQCDLYLPRHALHCGFIGYREAAGEADELSWEQIGELLGFEAKDVEHLSKQAYEILRQLAVQEQVPAEWSLLRNSKRCIVCNTCLVQQQEEAESNEEKEPPIFEQGWGWCSRSCYQWLPPAAVEAEARWGTWFRKLLSQWRQLNVKTVERLTGLSRDMVRWLLWQHLGWDDATDSTRWVKQAQPLVPNPKIPRVKEIVRRIQAAEQWGSS